VEDLPGILAIDRWYALFKPGDSIPYYKTYEPLGADALFRGVPDHLITWWCVWYGEYLNRASKG
jgi:hypothetical protein